MDNLSICSSRTDQCPRDPRWSSEDMFNSSDNAAKKKHSDILSAMIYIAHTLPFACMYRPVLEFIFDPSLPLLRAFHKKWPLNGWNDDIIQPTRDAVLEYYKVRTYTSLRFY